MADISVKQIAFIKSLMRDLGATPAEADAASFDGLSTREGSAMIDALLEAKKKAPKPAPRAAQEAVPASGYVPAKGDVHVVDGDFYRVYISQTTGRPYAQRVEGKAKTYTPGIAARFTQDTLATAEQAASFGRLYDVCVFCGLAIDTPESTAVGYGPVCAEKRGLPWGEMISA